MLGLDLQLTAATIELHRYATAARLPAGAAMLVCDLDVDIGGGNGGWTACRRTPIGVIRCRSSLRSVRTVLENTILTAVSTAVSTVVPTGTVSVIVLGQRPNRQGTG